MLIFKYQKHIDALVTREALLPVDNSGNTVGVELATVGGITYISLPSGTSLPANQPAEISASIIPVVLDADLRAAIKSASPHCALIKARRAVAISNAGYDDADQKALQIAGIGIGIGFLQPDDPRLTAVLQYAAVCKAADEAAAAAYTALGL